jgi:adenine-specific DNA-methyltransferase
MENKKKILGQFYTSKDVVSYMVSLITKNAQARILESGFGQGAFLDYLLDERYVNLTGYDIDEENYIKARKKYPLSVKLFHLDYLKSPIEEKFDVIIGNPPYVGWNRILTDVRENLIKEPFWKKYVNGEWDLLYAFIIWSIEKLNENGELIYIVPFNWFHSTYAASLRKYLSTYGSFEIINHFGEFKLFEDCAPNNIIFRYRKSRLEKGKGQPFFVSDFHGKKGNLSAIF